MVQANMLEAKTELSKLVRLLIARNNVPIVQMTLVDLPVESKRIGAAKGKFVIPDEFDAWDGEVEDMFEGIA